MMVRFGHDITVSCPQDTPMICMMSPRDERRDDLRSQTGLRTIPEVPTTSYRDLFGNTCRRFIAPAGLFTLQSDSTIVCDARPDPVVPEARQTPIAQLPDETLMYLLGSRYCETDRLSQIAWDLFGTAPEGWNRVQTICDKVNSHIKFDYMQARDTRTAYEAWQERIGVCRDFAHLAIAFCRCMNIPARYVNGYLGDIGVPVVGPMDFSAWMEVFLDGRWHTFDPRNNRPRIGRIVVAYGRDAADVPLMHSFGPHTLKSFTIWTDQIADS
ncbi:transglutaminase family protein [Tabrizicola sp. J26]|uniref:transglutaminase-like domain-containing protein n=1 Tax=Alitabrizicola rongguiensis TaxID=2909234 RepID=UPI001F1E6F7E|nr:transglutaminase family protein [Tabrizicola rongguiensis]MCF1707642.1 transglutaminase family protein [Tabrizicola rongguiensis]